MFRVRRHSSFRICVRSFDIRCRRRTWPANLRRDDRALRCCHTPEPGLIVAIGEAYYGNGSINGAIPIAHFNLQLGLDTNVSFTPITAVYIWPTEGKQWNFASSISLPIAYVEVEANVSLGRLNGQITDHNFGLFDIVFTPIIASYHITKRIISRSASPSGRRLENTTRIDWPASALITGRSFPGSRTRRFSRNRKSSSMAFGSCNSTPKILRPIIKMEFCPTWNSWP